MKLSDNGFDFISNFEGLYLRAYDDLEPRKTLTKTTEIKGTLTIGIGHTGKVNGKKLTWNTKITKNQAKQLLQEDISEKISILNKRITAEITQNMADALISITFNCGQNNTHVKKCIEYINAEEYEKAADAIANGTVTSKGVELAGLVKRRKAEAELFRKGMDDVMDVVNYKTIKKGSKGNIVKVWQLAIGTVQADGDFGEGTDKATREFQRKNNLKDDGIVGKNTWKAGLNNLFS